MLIEGAFSDCIPPASLTAKISFLLTYCLLTAYLLLRVPPVGGSGGFGGTTTTTSRPEFNAGPGGSGGFGGSNQQGPSRPG